MFTVDQPALAILLCLLTMLCWGSWTNGQKIVTESAPLPLFYRDYVYGILAMALLLAFTLGSFGSKGRPLLTDVGQAEMANLLLALAGGVVFNVGNSLLAIGISRSGISIAMPIGTGLSLAVGLVVNYLAEPKGNLPLLAVGGGAVLAAIAFSALAYRSKEEKNAPAEHDQSGIWIALAGGLVAGFFFRIVSASMAKEPANPEAGLLTPYSALVLFSIGITLSNPIIERLTRRFGLADTGPAKTADRRLTLRQHGIGLASGLLWSLGMAALLLGSPQAGDAVSYGLSQGATIVSVLWGLFLWKEFEGAPARAYRYLWLMGIAYVVGLLLIVLARS
ncbi:GRP family sugar transporter [Larkinella knui]|uniref:Multidrug DMT transporter permease n=1 Tax=Larkinella knui TaxID=2025310 RepID=A0A3P1CXS5_9BACT|nr:GRP family sugar transporter [Larkinella knui]RRB18093.1 multidrug DMT transporter permease [Larkinella knui]